MPATYEPLATTSTTNATTTTVTFSGFSSSFTDLVIVVAGTHTTTLSPIGLRFNSDTGSNYSRTMLQGDGSSATSSNSSNATIANIGLIGTSQTNTIFQIMNYANSTTYKTVLARANNSGSTIRANVGLWRSTSAITSIDLIVGDNYYSSGVTFTLYGIKSA